MSADRGAAGTGRPQAWLTADRSRPYPSPPGVAVRSRSRGPRPSLQPRRSQRTHRPPRPGRSAPAHDRARDSPAVHPGPFRHTAHTSPSAYRLLRYAASGGHHARRRPAHPRPARVAYHDPETDRFVDPSSPARHAGGEGM